jgi:uncharacterized protein YcnI
VVSPAATSDRVILSAEHVGSLASSYENDDEFVFPAYLTDSLKPGEMLYFPTIQECQKGVHRWIEIPAEGKKADEYKEPACELAALRKATPGTRPLRPQFPC